MVVKTTIRLTRGFNSVHTVGHLRTFLKIPLPSNFFNSSQDDSYVAGVVKDNWPKIIMLILFWKQFLVDSMSPPQLNHKLLEVMFVPNTRLHM